MKKKVIKFIKEFLKDIEYVDMTEFIYETYIMNGFDEEDVILALEALENKGYLHCEGEYIIKTEGIEE